MSEIQQLRNDILELDRQIRRLRAQQQQLAAGDLNRASSIVGVIPPANIPAHGSIGLWTNQSGGALGIGAVVIQNGDRQFDTTTTVDDLNVVGVLTEAIANTAEGRLRHQGYHPSVIVEGAVVAGQFLRTSTTAGAAEDAGVTPTAGTFGIALTTAAGPGAGTVAAYLFGTIGGVSDHGPEILLIVAKSGAYTLTAEDGLVIADASGGTFTLTLPTAVGITGRVYRVKKIDATANVVTVDANGAETIDGAVTATLTIQYEAITVVSDGTEWWVL